MRPCAPEGLFVFGQVLPSQYQKPLLVRIISRFQRATTTSSIRITICKQGNLALHFYDLHLRGHVLFHFHFLLNNFNSYLSCVKYKNEFAHAQVRMSEPKFNIMSYLMTTFLPFLM